MTIRVYRPTGVTGGTVVGDDPLSDNPVMDATGDPWYDSSYVELTGGQTATATFQSLPEATVTRFRIWFASTVVSETADQSDVSFALKNAAGTVLFSDHYRMSSSVGRELNAFSFVNITDPAPLVGQPLTLEMRDVTPDGGATYRILEVWLQVDGEFSGCSTIAALGTPTVALGTPVIVGDAPLTDGDPATYVAMQGAPGTDSDVVNVPLSGGPGATADVWMLTVNASADINQDLYWDIVGVTTPGAYSVSSLTTIVGGGPADYTIQLMPEHWTFTAFDPSELGAYIATGAVRLRLGNNAFPGGGTITVHEVELRGYHPCDVGGRPRRRPLRQFPRDDGLGMSSARRQDANRSMQASLRRGGGVYF